MDYGLPVKSDFILGGSLKFTVPGYMYSTIKNSKEGPLPSLQTLGSVLSNLQAQGVLFAEKPMYFGGQRLLYPATAGGEIIVDNSRGARVVYLPVDSNGQISLTMLKEMQKVQDYIAKQGITDEDTLRETWESHNFKYNEKLRTGEPYGYNLRPF